MTIREGARGALMAVQSVTRTNMLYLVKGGFWLTAGSFASSLSSFVLAVVFANLLPKEAYGTYKFILSVVGVCSSFTLTGALEATIRAVARGHEGTVRAAYRASFLWGLVVSGAMLAGAGYYAYQDNSLLAAALVIAAATGPFINAGGLYAAFLHGRKGFRAATAMSVLRNIFPVAALLATVSLTREILPLVAAYFIGHAVAASAAYLHVLRRFRPNDQADPEATRLGAHLSLMNVIGSLSSYADKILIFHYVGAAEVAAYSLALALPDQIDGVMGNIRALALPNFSQRSATEIRKTVFRKVGLWTLLLAAVAAAYLVAAPFLYRLLFPQYPEAIPYTLALSLGIVAVGSTQLLLAFFTSQQAVRERYIITTVSPLLRIILMFLLVRSHGIWGIVFARVFTKYLSAGLTFVLARRLR